MIHEYDEIVIGSNLTAVLYAFNNKLPIFYTHPQRPFRFDHLKPTVDLSCIGLQNTPREILTHEGKINIGTPKRLLWERLLFVISLAGRAPLSTLCHSMRHNGESLICSNEYSKIAQINFQKAYYFGDLNCSGLVDEKIVANPRYMCYDWIAFNRGGKHEIDLIETTDNFVNKIWFYPTDRVDGNSPVKDACLVSTLTEEQLLDFDYSQTMARFKMVAEMRDRGMRGPFNGYSPKGAPKYYNFRTAIISRETKSQSKSSCSSISTVEIAEKTKEEDLLHGMPEAATEYSRFVEGL
tara:strand:- start:1040 stop:1924 length:885 start_codon:yes stop_codon:yes gene_type:complete